MDASIIVLTKNGGDNFPRLLESLFSQEYAAGFEVIVIDSGSTDGTLEIANKYPLRLVKIEPEEFHHGKARNLGAGLADGKYLVYITQDALPASDEWLKKLTDNFDAPETAMVVGRQIPWEYTKPPEKFFYYYNFPDFRITVKSDMADYYHDNVFISNVNAAIRKDIWQKYRFSENIIMAEDKEIAVRLLKDGFDILYEPKAIVYHAHNYSLKGLFSRSLSEGIALSQGVESLPKSKMNNFKKVCRLSSAELAFIKNNDACRWIPYAILYNSSKYVGLLIGKAGFFKKIDIEEIAKL
jgi:rhamnosyltransferase